MQASNEEARKRLLEGGWKERSLPGFIGTAGPLWTRRDGETWSYGLLCDPRHLNPAGRMHGGALMTLLDHTLSTVAWEDTGRKPCVTLQLDTQFLGPVTDGQFVEAKAQITHRTKRLLFLRGAVSVDGVPVLHAQGILKAMQSDA
jgi:uncharacterized protein (TIGR00369 family)